MSKTPYVVAAVSSFVFLLAGLAVRDLAPRVVAVQPATAETAPKPGTMNVTGQARLEVSPDCADLTITLSSDNLKPGAATNDVGAKETALVAALTKLGIDSKDIRLSNMSLEPIYEPTEPNRWPTVPLKIHTFRSSITVTATTRDFSKIGSMMDAGASAGAIAMTSSFRRSDLAELKKQVRDMALAAAKAKAKQTADALGIKVGRVLSVAEAANGYMWGNEYFPQVANEARVMNGGGVALGGVLQPLTLDVTINFELA
jgi:uncharacterized protein YggE